MSFSHSAHCYAFHFKTLQNGLDLNPSAMTSFMTLDRNQINDSMFYLWAENNIWHRKLMDK